MTIPSKGLPNLRPVADDGFDEKYGVETNAVVRMVMTDSANVLHGNRYEAVSEEVMRWIIENAGLPIEQTTFIDVGCGKGRALVIAAGYPFKAIVGVEYGHDLVKVCRANMEKIGASERCQVVLADATQYDFPDGDLLAFFHNPFGDIVYHKVLDNLARTIGRIRLVHLGPNQEIVVNWGKAREIARGAGGARIYELA